MNLQIRLLHYSIEIGLMNPFNNSKPIMFKYLGMNKMGYNLCINFMFLYLYYHNLKDIY